MKKFKTIILFVYILLFSNLLLKQKLFSSVIIFLAPNLYFSVLSKLSQKNINKLSLVELLFWLVNIYFILINNFDAWFLALNNLLWLITSIKMIEVRNNYNHKNIILFLLLTVGTSSLFNVNFTSNIIHTLSLILLLYSLLVFNNYKSSKIINQLIILSSFLPFTLISTLIIPSPKPWFSLNSNNLAKKGISSELRPGDISTLAQSEDLVARVFFTNNLPKPKDRYWRVFVLDSFENNTWKSTMPLHLNDDINKRFSVNIKDNNLKNSNNEKWILEPNFIRHRPWSGKGNSYNNELKITDKGILLSKQVLRKREQYQISYTKNFWREVSPEKVKFNIKSVNNKRLFNLSRKWLKESSNPSEILKKSKEWFLKEGFTYSINPGVMNQNSPYDEFLFQKKKGFCEHFAASFALLMQYANIPARVVVGYQGGEIYNDNKGNEYVLIDNSFAHAWNEIWIEEKGWIRIDPTSWISPERIQESSLLINKDKSRFAKLTRNINLKFISSLIKLDLIFTEFSEEIRSILKISNFSENKIINRIYSISLLISTLFLSILIHLLLEFKNKYKFVRNTLNIYLYSLSLFKLKIRKGDTLKSFSIRVNRSYPEIKKEIKEIYRNYNLYKFRGINLSIQKFLLLFFKLTYYEIRVLNHILIKNLNSTYKKYTKIRK